MRRNQRTRRWIGTALFQTVGLVVGLTNVVMSRSGTKTRGCPRLFLGLAALALCLA